MHFFEGHSWSAVAAHGANETFTAVVTPLAVAGLSANLGILRILVVDADEVAAEIMLPRERSTTCRVRASEWLGPIWVMSGDVGLQIVGPGEGSWAIRAVIFAAIIDA